MKTLRLFRINIQTGKYSDVLQSIMDFVQANKSAYICAANSHMIVESQKSKLFNSVLNNADLITTDGMPLTWLSKLIASEQVDRVAGMDLFGDLIKVSEATQKRVFFYGNIDEVLTNLINLIRVNHPDILIAGSYSPPFHVLSKQEDIEIINKINSTHPDLIFVSLGCPKQEIWMADHKGKINSVMIGVGNAFLTYLGTEKRLPKIYRNLGLEWLYRLIQNPKRLLKRYMSTNFLFIYYTIIEIFYRYGKSHRL